jgi:hypothetical protein
MALGRRHPRLSVKPLLVSLAVLAVWCAAICLLSCQPAPARPDLASPVTVYTVPCPSGEGNCFVIEPQLPKETP